MFNIRWIRIFIKFQCASQQKGKHISLSISRRMSSSNLENSASLSCQNCELTKPYVICQYPNVLQIMNKAQDDWGYQAVHILPILQWWILIRHGQGNLSLSPGHMSRAPAVFASDEHADPDGHLDRARHHGMSVKIWKQKQTHPSRMAIGKIKSN